MKYVIHADDFGMTKGVNSAILDLIRKGGLSSTSVMANMPFLEDVQELIKIKGISVGLHSTLTQGKPISNIDDIHSIVDKEGSFFREMELIKKARTGSIDTRHIYIELKAQYDKVSEISQGNLVFIDSHHGIHNKVKQVKDAFLQVGRDRSIPFIRTRQIHCPRRNCQSLSIVRPGLSTIPTFGVRRALLNQLMVYRSHEFSRVYRIADGMLVNDSGDLVDMLKLLADQNHNFDKDKRIFYSVAHPSTDIEGLEDSNLQEQRVKEYKYLASDDWLRYVGQNGGLSSFKDFIA